MFVTPAETDQGFKDVKVTLKCGTEVEVRLTAPSRKQMRKLMEEAARTNDMEPFYCACLPEDKKNLLDKVEFGSANMIENISLELCFGEAVIQNLRKSVMDTLVPNGQQPGTMA